MRIFPYLSIARYFLLCQSHLSQVRVITPREIKANADQNFQIHAAPVHRDELRTGDLAMEVPAKNAFSMSAQQIK